LSKSRLPSLLEAGLVTFLWSSSYLLVKIGLTQVSPLTLVSLRYLIASAILLSLALAKGEIHLLKGVKNLLKLGFLGISGYTIAQGLQCLGLFYLPAISVTFILNFTPVIVLILGAMFHQEKPSRLQLGGMGIVLFGAYLFFNAPLSANSLAGTLITLLSGVGWAAYLVSSRRLFAREKVNPLGFTAFTMGLGTIAIATAAYSVEGFPQVLPFSWAIILWLGVVNTAFAFFLWNHALQRVEAFEISILQNSMLIQIAMLSWLFLGEELTGMKIFSIALVFVGVLMVQLKGRH